MDEIVQNEIWKDYPADERYKVSNLGRVIGAKGKLLKQARHPDGYMMVAVGMSNLKLVHRMVMETFEPDNVNEVVCHNDNDKTNNRLENLRWDTQKNNLNDRHKHGTMTRGSRNGNAKLTESEVIQIKRLLSSGLRQCDIVRQTSASRHQIYMIATGKHWTHINV